MTLKAQEIYGMAAVKISRAVAERAIALTRSNSRSTWEAILRSSRRVPASGPPPEQKAPKAQRRS